ATGPARLTGGSIEQTETLPINARRPVTVSGAAVHLDVTGLGDSERPVAERVRRALLAPRGKEEA
ncbi:MAG TPA: hypothetical protein VMS64_00375, partial [Candidatus Methylomirabilis sp.]|nr:hypothetical protein [Candidatus Methylomirabilis sp.]